MPQYVCIIKQAGEGCDYTIGCGTVAYSFEAPNWNDAFQKIKKDFDWDEYEDSAYTEADVIDVYRGERALESCVIYEVSGKLDTLYETYFNNLIIAKQSTDEDKATKERRKQYEKLQKEFG